MDTPTLPPANLPRGVQVLRRKKKDGTETIKYRVQIKRANFNADEVFDEVNEAIEFLNASKSVTGQKQIKLLEIEDKKLQEVIADFLSNPTLDSYISAYLQEYIDPKYSNFDPKTKDGKFRLRHWKNIKSFYKTIKETEIEKRTSGDEASAISSIIYRDKSSKKRFGLFKPSEVTEIEINSYIKARLAKGLKAISIQREITHISNVFKKLRYLDPNLKTIRNPCLDYDKDLLKSQGPLITKHEFRLSDDDREILFKALDEYSNPELSFIVKLSLLTAMRRSEIVLLTWDSIYLDDGFIHLKRTKSGKDRIVHLIPQAKDLISQIPKREGENYLFSYTVLGFQGSFDKFLEKTKLEEKIKGFHAFRKESISNFIEQIGAGNSMLIAEFIGMSSAKKLEENYIERELKPNGYNTQEEAMKNFGHSDIRVTQGHYFTLRKKK